MMRTAQAVAGVAALFIYLIYWNFGTLSPCGVLRETVRQRDGLAATPLGSTVDVASQNGALSPTRCLSLFLSQKQELLSIAPRLAPQRFIAGWSAVITGSDINKSDRTKRGAG